MLIQPFIFRYSDMYVFFIHTTVYVQTRLATQVSSIEHNSGIVAYRRNFGIDPALGRTSYDFVSQQNKLFCRHGVSRLVTARNVADSADSRTRAFNRYQTRGTIHQSCEIMYDFLLIVWFPHPRFEIVS